MGRKPSGRPNGRPPKEFNVKQFEGLCRIQCTEEEICAVMEMDKVTLIKKIKENYNGASFSTVLKEKSQGGKASLRRTQLRLAEKNAAMAIWCGKQYLGQKDHQDIDITSGGEKLSIPVHSFVATNKGRR